MSIKRIEAIIRPEKLEPLRLQLQQVGYPGMMVTSMEGHGKQRGLEQQWRGIKFNTYFLDKVKVELVVTSRQLKKVIGAIMAACSSGQAGDGKIFISDVHEVIRIRTKERGEKAVG